MPTKESALHRAFEKSVRLASRCFIVALVLTSLAYLPYALLLYFDTYPHTSPERVERILRWGQRWGFYVPTITATGGALLGFLSGLVGGARPEDAQA